MAEIATTPQNVRARSRRRNAPLSGLVIPGPQTGGVDVYRAHTPNLHRDPRWLLFLRDPNNPRRVRARVPGLPTGPYSRIARSARRLLAQDREIAEGEPLIARER